MPFPLSHLGQTLYSFHILLLIGFITPLCVCLGIEPRASKILSKHSITELLSPAALLYFLYIYFFIFCVFCLHVCMLTMRVLGACVGQKRASDLLEL